MDLELKKLNKDNDEDIKAFEQIYLEAFPASERMGFDELFDYEADTRTDILGIYDDGQRIGFAVVLANSECGYIYYLAIDSRVRSKGYGSAALQKLKEVYSELQLILDFEKIDENAENNGQRVRRKSFYLQNGFSETGNYTIMRDERFEVVCVGGELNKPAFKDLIHIINTRCPEFEDLLI